MRKPVFGVSDLVRHKPGCTATEDGLRLEISDLESRGIATIYVAKTKALISFAVAAKLICVFVFAYEKCWFSHDAAQMLFGLMFELCLKPYHHDPKFFDRHDWGNSNTTVQSQISLIRVFNVCN